MKLLSKNISVNCNRDAEAEEGNQNLENQNIKDSFIFCLMERENCWVWFKGSLKEGGVWKGGFSAKKDENPGVLIKNPSYAQCRVPDWRISNTEPIDKYKGPTVPENAVWKIF